MAKSRQGLSQLLRMHGIIDGDGSNDDSLYFRGRKLYIDCPIQPILGWVADNAIDSSHPGDNITILGGASIDGSGQAGGNISITGGANGGSLASGGAVRITGGDGGTSNGAGGNLSLTGGAGHGGGGGTVSLSGGHDNGVSGGEGGLITITAGDGGGTSNGNGGNVTMTAGAAGSGSNANGGAITLKTGPKDGTGLKPLVSIDAAGDTPTTSILTSSGALGFKYNAGGTLVAYVNNGGAIKSLSLGTPV